MRDPRACRPNLPDTAELDLAIRVKDAGRLGCGMMLTEFAEEDFAKSPSEGR